MVTDGTALRNELQHLTRELSNLVEKANASGGGTNAQSIAGAFAAAISGLDTRDAASRAEHLIETRPIATVASVFALGMALGLLLRRH
ncbi:hypothetical protein [Bradyrhizobium sp. HKCCYLR20261]|uniref:hypothetical protein n=1 Tax=Bradyrhizobium sp. HKCCYLR20261 TaxID=3420760 RepID=UPI003EBCFE95